MAHRRPNQADDALGFVRLHGTEDEQPLDACGGLAGLGSCAAQPHRTLASRARDALRELEERALARAPHLIGHGAVAPRERLRDLLGALQGFESDGVGIEPVMFERAKRVVHGISLGLASIAGLTPPNAQPP
jgi:hypothetical protein